MKNVKITVVSIYDPQNKWIGNIAIDLEKGEVENYLENGYTIYNKKEENN